MNLPAYPTYKASGVAWLGDVPEGWEVKRLKDVGILIGGAGFPHEFQNIQGGCLYFYKVGDLSLSENGRTLEKSDHSISKEIAKYLRATIVPRGAIVYAKIGAALLLNRRRVTIAECCIDNNMTAYVGNHDFVSSEWAFYWLANIDFGEHVNPGAVPSFSEGYQAYLPIFLPPLAEQAAIATYLDRETAKIDALVEKQHSMLDLLKEKRTATISHAVTKGLNPNAKLKNSGVAWLGQMPEGWEVKKLRRVAIEVKTGTTPPGAEEYYFDDNGLSWHTPSDFSNEVRLGRAARKLSTQGMEYTRQYPKQTVMIVGIGATMGKVGITEDTASCNQQINAICFGERILPIFAVYFLSTLREYLFSCGKFTTLPILNQEDTKNITICIPPLPEQAAIATFLDRETTKIDALAARIEAMIAKLQEYRTALITAAVTGKVDVRQGRPHENPH